MKSGRADTMLGCREKTHMVIITWTIQHTEQTISHPNTHIKHLRLWKKKHPPNLIHEGDSGPPTQIFSHKNRKANSAFPGLIFSECETTRLATRPKWKGDELLPRTTFIWVSTVGHPTALGSGLCYSTHLGIWLNRPRSLAPATESALLACFQSMNGATVSWCWRRCQRKV